MVGCGVPYLYAGNIRDKSTASFVAGSHDPRKTGAAERLSACGICDHDLIATKRGIDLAGAKHRLVAIGAGHDDNLMQNVIFDIWVRDYPVNWRVFQKIP